MVFFSDNVVPTDQDPLGKGLIPTSIHKIDILMRSTAYIHLGKDGTSILRS